jgi:hypothetical protein
MENGGLKVGDRQNILSVGAEDGKHRKGETNRHGEYLEALLMPICHTKTSVPLTRRTLWDQTN